MADKWTVEALSADRTIVTLTQLERLAVHPGDHVDIKIGNKWRGGNRAEVIELLETGFSGNVARENRRARYGTPTQLGTFFVPYTAIVGRIY